MIRTTALAALLASTALVSAAMAQTPPPPSTLPIGNPTNGSTPCTTEPPQGGFRASEFPNWLP